MIDVGPGSVTKGNGSSPVVERRSPATFKGRAPPTKSELIQQAKELVQQARTAVFDDARDLYGRAAILYMRAGDDETANKLITAARKADPLTEFL